MNAQQRRSARRLERQLIRHAVPVRFRKWWTLGGFAYGVVVQAQRTRLPQVRVMLPDSDLYVGTVVSLFRLQAEARPLKGARGVAPCDNNQPKGGC